MNIKTNSNRIALLGGSVALLAGMVAPQLQASGDYGPAHWRPAYPGHWYTSGYGKRFFVVHDIEGYYWTCISYFQRSTTRASVHYTINGKQDNGSDAAPGEVSQMVADAYYAWHAGCWNQYSMGTEHEGFASNPAWYTEPMYQASAALTASKCDKYGIPKDHNHVISHGQKTWEPGWVGWAQGQGYSYSWATCQTHTDPGPYWNWGHYMDLVVGGGAPPPPPVTNPPYVFNSDTQGWTAGNGMTPVVYNNSGWPGIIYNDQTGNDAFNFGPACSFGGGGDPSANVSFYPQSGNTANHDMQIFWKTAQDNTWSAGKSSPVVSYSAQNAWVTLNLDINANWPTWFGKDINQLRLDYDNNNSGTRWIVNHLLVQTTPRSYFGASTEGWVAGNSVLAPWWTDGGWPGILVVDQTGNDAFITKAISGYRGAANDRIHVRVYPQGGSGVNHDMQLFFATGDENFYSAAKSTPVAYFSGKDTWVDLWFDVGANAYWSGYTGHDITGLRLDFDNANNGNVRWIIDYIIVEHSSNPSANTINNAAIVSVSAPATVNAGATFSATVTMNNSGSRPWGGNHKLGSQSPQDNNTWGLTRVAVAGTINPGANYAFTFNATAPATLGAKAFDWKMLEEGVQWFGPIAQATVTVISPGPTAPSGVGASAASWNQINVNWTDNSANETGFKVQRSTASGGPYSDIATTAANTTSYSNTGLNPATTYYYRVLSFNSGGDSVPSNVASAAPPNQPPDLAAVGNKTGTEGAQLTFTASSSNPNQLITTTTWATWEGNAHGNMEIVFRKPGNSATTSSFIDGAVTNYTMVSSIFPAGGGGARVLKSSWSFNGGANAWIRLTTAGAPTMPNPAISQDQILRFKIHSTKALKVGVGVRETGTTVAYGANGGTTGTIDWAAVTNVISGAPIPSKLIPANTWTTVDINIPFEGQAGFTGDGAISSGKGVLEHLALRAEGGTGVYDVYLDDMAVVEPNTLTYSLDAGAPAGATIHPKTGVFKWTPGAGQSGNHTITVRVTDRLALTDFETIAVSVVATGNHKPVLAAIGNKAVNENTALQFTALATDQDAGQTLTFSLDAGNPSGSSISTGGAFTWTPTEAQGTGGTYPITVRVTDNGAPASNAFETITVTVNEVNGAPALAAIADQTINEGSTLAATAAATDADVPANSITYSLDAGSPTGMTISSSSGAIAWTTGESHGPATYPVTARATDGGGLSDAKTFNVTVNEVNIAPGLTLNTTLTSVETITDFESFQSSSYSGTVLFRQPAFSSSTIAFVDTTATNYTTVTTAFPGGDSISKVLYATWSFKTGQVNPWLRLTAYNTSVLPNPTVNFNQRVRFRIHSDKALGVALGLRETDTGAVIGQNGGITGTMEWAGATLAGANPVPTRTVTANTWTTLEFILPSETISAFTGNSILTSTTGKGVLEHLALTPAGGTGVYNVYLDDFVVVNVTTSLTVNNGQTVTFTSASTDADFPAQTLTYSLDTPPAGATINANTGDFSWTPTVSQAPSTNVITVRVTDSGPGNLSATANATIIVNKVNTAPTITGVPEQAVELQGGQQIALTIAATDNEGDALTFSLQNSPPAGAAIVGSTGAFTWTPPNTLSNYTISVRATDTGGLYDQRDMIVAVTPTNAAPVLSLNGARITEKVVNFESMVNYASDVVMFRKPLNSSSTSSFIDTAVTNYTFVATSGVPAGNPNAGAKTLKAGWSFKTGTTNPWLRFTSFNPVNIPNVTIDLGARVKFDIHCDKAIKVGLGVRETGTASAIGGNGGTTGAIEWIGATKSGTAPTPSRVVNANTWTTLEFNLPVEYCTNYSAGNSVLAAGKGVIEHIIVVPNGGMGVYTMYLDNFEVVSTPALPSTVTMNANSSVAFTASATDPDPGSGLNFGLDATTPAGTAIDIATGAFTWTPAITGTTNLTVYVNDNPTNGAPTKTASLSFTVNVNSDPLAVQTGSFVAGGDTVNLTWDSVAGRTYVIQSKEGPDGEWANQQQVTATGATSAVQIANDGGDSVFRVVEVGGTSDQ